MDRISGAAHEKDEIEVTPEMIDAGTLALMPFYMGDGAYDLRAPGLTAVYRAMREAVAKSGRLAPQNPCRAD